VRVDGGDAVKPGQAGLPNWQLPWNTHLDDFCREMDQAAAANRQDPAYQITYYPIVGRDQPTRQSALLTGGILEIREDRDGKDESGDGTVPLLSAALSGTEKSRAFAPDQHARLQGSVPLQTHLKGVVCGTSQQGIDRLRGVTTWFGLAIDDVFLPDEPVRLSLQPHRVDEPDAAVAATVVVTDEATGAEALRRDVTLRPDGSDIELGVMRPSEYVVAVSAGRRSSTVSDIFTVASPEELQE
jgi:hypothetical protein